MPATPAWPPGSLPRLFVEGPLEARATVPLTGAQAKYLGAVLRLGPGAPVHVFDDRTGEWLAHVAELGRKAGDRSVSTESIAQTNSVERREQIVVGFQMGS